MGVRGEEKEGARDLAASDKADARQALPRVRKAQARTRGVRRPEARENAAAGQLRREGDEGAAAPAGPPQLRETRDYRQRGRRDGFAQTRGVWSVHHTVRFRDLRKRASV